MGFFDYKVVPAPRKVRKIKGIRGTPDLFAMILTETINEVARQGWEYVRAESMTAEAPGGWFRRGAATDQTVLVFRRPRETLSPRLTADDEPSAVGDTPEPVRTGPTPLHPVRAEPSLGDSSEVPAGLRATPRFGPADDV